MQVTVDYQVVPGSLPRLRFGRTYQMRARCVDLAGNSQPLSAIEGKDAVAPPEAFGRLEPIGAPVVVRRSPRPTPGVGDTPYEIVLRSDFDIDDADVAPVDRLLFPGRVGQDLVELHGLPAGGADPGSYAELATAGCARPGRPDRRGSGHRRDRRGRRVRRPHQAGSHPAGRRLPLRSGDRRCPVRVPQPGRGRYGLGAQGLARAAVGPAGRRRRR